MPIDHNRLSSRKEELKQNLDMIRYYIDSPIISTNPITQCLIIRTEINTFLTKLESLELVLEDDNQ